MLHQTQDPDENLALEACEFWSAIAEMEVKRGASELAKCEEICLPTQSYLAPLRKQQTQRCAGAPTQRRLHKAMEHTRKETRRHTIHTHRVVLSVTLVDTQRNLFVVFRCHHCGWGASSSAFTAPTLATLTSCT